MSAAARIAIIGASGQLGSALVSALAGRDVIAPSHAECPIEEPAAIEQLLTRERPATLVNCAAFHSVDVIERGAVEQAFAVNAIAVDRAAAACAAAGVGFMTVSTDYVFDGTLDRPYREGDAPNPLTAYGASKLAGEQLVRRHGDAHYIVRTSAVYGGGTSNKGYTLVDKVLAQAERGEPTRMVSDMTFSPSYAPEIARVMRELIDRRAYGTHHVAGSGACSWYEFVLEAFALAGLAHAPLEPAPYAALNNPTRRPMFSALESTTLGPLGIAPMPLWREALATYIARRRVNAGV